MWRRSEKRIGLESFIAELVRPSVDWSEKRLRLERQSLHDYQQRSISANISIAELYHENSKLFPEMVPRLTGVHMESTDFRLAIVRRRAMPSQSGDDKDFILHQAWRDLITAVVRTTDLELFFAVELRVIANDDLAVYEPVSDEFRAIKRLSSSDQSHLRRALAISGTRKALQHDAILFVVGRFAWNDVLFGPRGYRRTLLEAGQVIGAIVRESSRRHLSTHLNYEFTDRDVDGVIEADGTEEGAILAIECGAISDGS
jgi:hypothetical protein